MNPSDQRISSVLTAAKELRALESRFIEGVQAKSRTEAERGHLPGSVGAGRVRGRSDLRLRISQAGLSGHGNALLDVLPEGRVVRMELREPSWLGLSTRVSGELVGVFFADHDALLAGRPQPPVGSSELAQVLEQLGPMQGVGYVAVCAPGGFSPEVRAAELSHDRLKLALLTPADAEGGAGWRLVSNAAMPAAVLACFDTESETGKIARVAESVAAGLGASAGSYLSAAALARRLNLKPESVRGTFEQLAAEQADLQLVRHDADLLLVRSLHVAKGPLIMEWLRKLLGRKADPAAQINELLKSKAQLEQRLQEVYGEVETLRQKESQLKDEARTASEATLKSYAAQITQVRKSIERQQATANVIAAQIEPISTHIHNLNLTRQTTTVKTPTMESMQETAAQAENLVAEIAAKQDIASSLAVGVGASDMLGSPEQDATLEELLADRRQAASEAAAGGEERAAQAAAPVGQTSVSAPAPAGASPAPASRAAKEHA